jgi:hypothetical protein|tara:strand:- start:11321 stop:12295 length:975 start_codon:yes stop_codon:yes gene_type:complete
MSPEQFESVLKVAVPFLKHSHADVGMKVNRNDDREPHRKKVLGIFGGEPLMHPEFPTLVDIMCKYVPQPHRGLWTSYDWVNGESKLWGAYKPQVERLLGKNPTGSVLDMSTGYLNWNMHEEDQPCSHSPVLVAADDVVKDKKERWDKISKCWIQTEWSAAYALDYNEEVKFYFCEVASAFDRVFNLGTGLPVEDGVWSHHLWFAPDKEGILQPHGPYAKQILSTCGRCGGSLRLEGRRDRENVDDVSPSNLIPLTVAGSPMIRKGQYNKVESAKDSKQDSEPWEYQKDGRAKQIENFKGAVGHADWLNTYVPKSRPKGDNEWNS